MSTVLCCAALLVVAVVLFVRELRLWRGRAESEGILFRYSRRRFVRRTAGCAILAAVSIMTLLGLEVLDFTGRLGLLQAWWAIIGLGCLALLVIPILDFRETYRHVTGDLSSEKIAAEMEHLRTERRERR